MGKWTNKDGLNVYFGKSAVERSSIGAHAEETTIAYSLRLTAGSFADVKQVIPAGFRVLRSTVEVIGGITITAALKVGWTSADAAACTVSIADAAAAGNYAGTVATTAVQTVDRELVVTGGGTATGDGEVIVTVIVERA